MRQESRGVKLVTYIKIQRNTKEEEEEEEEEEENEEETEEARPVEYL
jgi:hypothetical protein